MLSPYEPQATCTLQLQPPTGILMDIYTGLPAHWGASLRWWMMPYAGSLGGCLQMSFCNGQVKATYGDDQKWIQPQTALHSNVMDGGALAMADLKSFADV